MREETPAAELEIPLAGKETPNRAGPEQNNCLAVSPVFAEGGDFLPARVPAEGSAMVREPPRGSWKLPQ